jgi:Zn finger protein HypA/HybF involved in hydrogenase expression
MNVERLRVFAPFLLVDAILVFAVLWLLHLDWIVHHMLYDYYLQFSLDWAVPYWMAFRTSLALLFFAFAAVTTVGYISSKRTELESEKTVFLCKSCGSAWTELNRNVRIRRELPKFRILLTCPSCDKKLLDLETGVIQRDELEAKRSAKG